MENGTVKMMDGSACEIISTGTVKVTEKDEMMHALEAICPEGIVQSNIHKCAR